MASFANDLHSLPSVAGVVLTAMVLRDEEIQDLGFKRFVEVMGPKIKGDLFIMQARYLHFRGELILIVTVTKVKAIVVTVAVAVATAQQTQKE